MSTNSLLWAERASLTQRALVDHYWNKDADLFFSNYPNEDETGKPFNYWWQAHAIDALLDGYIRTREESYLTHVRDLLAGVLKRNSNTLHNDFYDDMEWMALALLRAYDLTGDNSFAEKSRDLWADIQMGWNDQVGGGIAWRKSQLFYKNAPANAPAIILAVRLYNRFGDEGDLQMAINIHDWMRDNLIDPATGMVWDGKNRQGDGKVDKDWRFTYCQGVYIGGCTELAEVTKDGKYTAYALQTIKNAMTSLINKQAGTLQDERGGDAGLFRGILVRYMVDFVRRNPECEDVSAITAFLVKNAETVWQKGRLHDHNLIGTTWAFEPSLPIDLSAHLSGVMLLEGVDCLR